MLLYCLVYLKLHPSQVDLSLSEIAEIAAVAPTIEKIMAARIAAGFGG